MMLSKDGERSEVVAGEMDTGTTTFGGAAGIGWLLEGAIGIEALDII